ncbi:hypothetical protein YB2330_006222 [Saitoella coloradoensis]
MVNADDSKVAQLKKLKNEVIGHQQKKEECLTSGIVPELIALLGSQDEASEVKIQLVIIIGSIAHGGDTVRQYLLGANVLPPVYAALSAPTSPPDLQIACLRVLTTLMDTPAAPRASLFTPSMLSILTKFLHISRPLRPYTLQQAELSMNLVHKCCQTEDQKYALADAGVIDALIAVIEQEAFTGGSVGQKRDSSGVMIHSKLVETALTALGTIIRGSPRLSVMLGLGHDVVPILLSLVRGPRPMTRLSAASVLSYMYRAGSIPKKHAGQIALVVVPILVRLFDDEDLSVAVTAPLVLAHLVTDGVDVQTAAVQADAIKKLSTMVTRISSDSTPATDKEKATESILLAVAALTLFKDDYRKEVSEKGFMPFIVTSLSSPNASVRAAACQCVRSMSRSVCILRTTLTDVALVPPMMKCLEDEAVEVRVAASAALCNLVLEFSPMRKTIMEHEILRILRTQVHDNEPALRLNAIWTLKHLFYKQKTSVKQSVLQNLGLEIFMERINDDDIAIQEQALDCFQNLTADGAENLDLLFSVLSPKALLDLILEKLQPGAPHQLVEPAIFILVHIAVGNDSHRNLILEDERILEALRQRLDDNDCAVRLGCVWTIINLTSLGEQTVEQTMSARHAVRCLRDIGIVSKIYNMTEDDTQDVRERVKTAIFQIQTCLSS